MYSCSVCLAPSLGTVNRVHQSWDGSHITLHELDSAWCWAWAPEKSNTSDEQILDEDWFWKLQIIFISLDKFISTYRMYCRQLWKHSSLAVSIFISSRVTLGCSWTSICLYCLSLYSRVFLQCVSEQETCSVVSCVLYSSGAQIRMLFRKLSDDLFCHQTGIHTWGSSGNPWGTCSRKKTCAVVSFNLKHVLEHSRTVLQDDGQGFNKIMAWNHQ